MGARLSVTPPKKRENSSIQRALANLPRLQGQTLRFPGQLELV